jgi:hypothetical protein
MDLPEAVEVALVVVAVTVAEVAGPLVFRVRLETITTSPFERASATTMVTPSSPMAMCPDLNSTWVTITTVTSAKAADALKTMVTVVTTRDLVASPAVLNKT